MKLVLDATPIIHAAKTRLHTFLPKLEVELFTTTIVSEEVLVEGFFEEKGVIEKLFEQQIKVLKSSKPLDKSRGLHAGEASALNLAQELGAVLVSDDRVARTVAKAKGIPVVHSTFLVFRALEKKAITRLKAEELVQELIESGWWCDAETLARVYNAIRKYD